MRACPRSNGSRPMPCATRSSPSATRCARTRPTSTASTCIRSRWRHRHEHGPHARRRGGRARAEPARAGVDVRGHQPRLVDGCPRQQRRHPQPDPARHRQHAEGRRPTARPPRSPRASRTHRWRRTRRCSSRSRAPSSPWSARRPTRHRRRPRRARRSPRCCAPLATAGRASLARTPEMLPVLKDAGVVDAGGAGFLLLLDSAIHVVDGDPLPEPAMSDDDDRPRPAPSSKPWPTGGEGRRQRSALRGDVLRRSRRQQDRGVQDRRGARSATRSSSSVATASGTATSTPTTSARRSRSRSTTAGGRTRSGSPTCSRRWPTSTPNERPRSAASRRSCDRRAAAAGLPPVTCAVVACRSGDGPDRAVRAARCAGCGHRRSDAEPVDGRAARCRRGRQRAAGDRAAEQQEHHPGRRAARRAHHEDGRRRAHAQHARGARRAGASTTRRPTAETNGGGDGRGGRVGRHGRGHPGRARHGQRRRARSPPATGSASSAATASSPSTARSPGPPRRCSTTSIDRRSRDRHRDRGVDGHRRRPPMPCERGSPTNARTCRSRCTAAGSRCTRTCSAWSEACATPE